MGLVICNAVMACSLFLNDFVVVSELQHPSSRPAIVTSDNPVTDNEANHGE